MGQQVEALTDEVGNVKAALSEAQARREAAEAREALLEKSLSEQDSQRDTAADSLKQEVCFTPYNS